MQCCPRRRIVAGTTLTHAVQDGLPGLRGFRGGSSRSADLEGALLHCVMWVTLEVICALLQGDLEGLRAHEWDQSFHAGAHYVEVMDLRLVTHNHRVRASLHCPRTNRNRHTRSDSSPERTARPGRTSALGNGGNGEDGDAGERQCYEYFTHGCEIPLVELPGLFGVVSMKLVVALLIEIRSGPPRLSLAIY